MSSYSIYSLFHFDMVAAILTTLVVFIGGIAVNYSVRYMQGDSHYTQFLVKMMLLVLSVSTMVAADHWLLLLPAWALSNSLLISLMIHQTKWHAARYSGWLAARTFVIGLISLSIALVILHNKTGQSSIHAMLQQFEPADSDQLTALVLIMIAAMTQSAIWPFHRWLVSSLNSPTPVSAVMHAGLVNGGGFLLARFAPMYFAYPAILNVILLIGLLSALVGTTWKLVQPDVKRMLACSTMGQMGFMFVQCGLGMFPAAIAHLCWHGMFKANLFLSANGIMQDERVTGNNKITITTFIPALACGLAGSLAFATGMHTAWLVNDSRIVLTTICAITACQFSLSILKRFSLRTFLLAITMTCMLCYCYGSSIYLFESLFSETLYQAQPLNLVHLASILLLTIAWLLVLFKDRLISHDSALVHRLYMLVLNASQPHRETITSYRSQYQYN